METDREVHDMETEVRDTTTMFALIFAKPLENIEE